MVFWFEGDNIAYIHDNKLPNSQKDVEKRGGKIIRDAKEFLVSSLARLSMQSPSRYPIVIQQSLEAANSAALAQFCSSLDALLFRCFITIEECIHHGSHVLISWKKMFYDV